jgi:hypothetical protein
VTHKPRPKPRKPEHETPEPASPADDAGKADIPPRRLHRARRRAPTTSSAAACASNAVRNRRVGGKSRERPAAAPPPRSFPPLRCQRGFRRVRDPATAPGTFNGFATVTTSSLAGLNRSETERPSLGSCRVYGCASPPWSRRRRGVRVGPPSGRRLGRPVCHRGATSTGVTRGFGTSPSVVGGLPVAGGHKTSLRLVRPGILGPNEVAGRVRGRFAQLSEGIRSAFETNFVTITGATSQSGKN